MTLARASGRRRVLGHPPPGLTGLLAVVGSNIIWGSSVVFFKQLDHLDIYTTAAHRVLWTAVLGVILLILMGRWWALATILSTPKLMKRLLVSALLIGSCWVIFVYAVKYDLILQISLSFYITPLVSMLVGVFILSERLTRAQWAAMMLAGFGVLNLVVFLGILPWVSVLLAICFSCYCYIRKTTPVGATEGLCVEVLILVLGAILWLLWASTGEGQNVMGDDWWTITFLLMLGPITAIPLVMFAYGVQRVRMVTVGLMQYLEPTMLFLMAVVVYGEPFNEVYMLTFILIWMGVCVFSMDVWRLTLRKRG
ncbi:MAG: EamA family transporter RarD [Parvularculales bacterium]